MLLWEKAKLSSRAIRELLWEKAELLWEKAELLWEKAKQSRATLFHCCKSCISDIISEVKYRLFSTYALRHWNTGSAFSGI